MMKALCEHGRKIVSVLENVGEPLVLLLTRLYVANVFFASGKLKFENFLNDDWASTVFLFQEVHPVPFLPAEIAAPLGTASELGFSFLLAFGLLGRVGAAGLLAMTGVIELSFQLNDPEYQTLPQHSMWALLLAVVLVRGSGKLSLDTLLCRWKGFCPASNG